MNKLIFVLILLLSLTVTLFSQNGLSIQTGVALPVLDDGKISDTRYAGIGFNGNIKYTYLLKNEKYGFFTSFDIIYGRLKNSEKEKIEESIEGYFRTDDLKIKHSNDIDLPLIFGFNYTFINKDHIKFSSNIGAGVNFLKLTDSSVEGEEMYQKSEYNLSTGFGYKLGLNIISKKHFIIFIEYFGSKNKIKVTNSDGDKKSQQILIGIGYNF